MPKKVKEDLDFFYLDKKNKNSKNKVKKPVKKVTKKRTSVKQKENNEEDIFKFDDEIVIGLTPKNEKQDKKNVKKNTKKKTNNKKIKNNNKKVDEKKVKKNKNILKILKWGFIFTILITAIILFLMSPLFNIKKISINGNAKITNEEMISLSRINIDENIFKLNKKEVTQNIKENAYIESIKISRKLPDEIIVTVKERVATYMLEFANGFVYINNQGYMLEITEEKLNVPKIRDFATPIEQIKVGNRLVKEDLQKLETVLKIMKSAESNGINELITDISIKDEENYVLILEGENKTVYLGDATSINTRMLYLQKIIEENKGKSGEAFINMDINKKNVFFREKV